MRIRRTATLLVSLALAGCSLAPIEQTLDGGLTIVGQAGATDAVALTLLESPQVPLPDGGAGPAVTALTVFFGSRAAGDTTSQLAGIPGASVTTSDTAGDQATCADLGGGSYLATSADGGLRYDPSATYTFTLALDGGSSYVATGTAPEPETVPAFQEAISLDGGFGETQVAVGNPYTLTRHAAASGSKLDVAFVTVNAISGGSASESPTYTTVPTTALGLLGLIADDSQYRAPSFVLPATAFPTPGEYLVTLTAVKKGAPQGTNLFLGSAILLGAGSAGVFQAK